MTSARRVARWGALGLAGLAGVVLLALGTLCVTSGCASVDYLGQSALGQYRVMSAARPVSDVIADPLLPAPLRMRLELTQRMRDFAVRVLKLPDNASYRSYADLKRGAAVWNVVAAPALSLKLKTWCFPIVGCVGYRGYFDQKSAEEAAGPLRAEGLDVEVYPVPAYSTLGFMNWLGGDPLLNTFVQWPEGELARLMFHELAHQEAYASGDTTFNESFATAVERIGGRRWLAAYGTDEVRAEQARIDQRRQDFRTLVRRCRGELQALFDGPLPDAQKLERKAAVYAALKADYEAMKTERWNGFKGYDRWFATVDNAALGTLGAYDDKVDTFERMFEAQGEDFARFYAEVRRLAALPKAQRDAALAQYAAPSTASSGSRAA
jgi:predicted aminopeptidase